MMNITYFHRNRKLGFSIGKVSKTYIEEMKKYNNVYEFYMPCADASPLAIIKNLCYSFIHRNINGINHITGDIHYIALTLPRKRTVLTVHDMIGVHANKGIKRFFIWFIWFYLPCKWASQVTCISETTKKELIKIAKCNSQKITVISNPISEDFIYKPKSFNKSKPIILHIGTRSNKNLERIIKAIENISCHLRIIGDLDNHQIKILNDCKIDFSNGTKLSDKEIVEEYVQCDIVSFPSLFEGFGMPIIEGQKTGRIILTSDLEPMKSIANGGALFVNPYDINSIRSGILNVIDDDMLREKLINVGNENVKRFSADTIAESYLNLYKSML